MIERLGRLHLLPDNVRRRKGRIETTDDTRCLLPELLTENLVLLGREECFELGRVDCRSTGRKLSVVRLQVGLPFFTILFHVLELESILRNRRRSRVGKGLRVLQEEFLEILKVLGRSTGHRPIFSLTDHVHQILEILFGNRVLFGYHSAWFGQQALEGFHEIVVSGVSTVNNGDDSVALRGCHLSGGETVRSTGAVDEKGSLLGGNSSDAFGSGCQQR